MHDSAELYYLEISLWVSCIAMLGYVNFSILKKIILDDLRLSNNIENFQHRYSAIISIIAAAIFTIISYRISNKFFIEFIPENGMNDFTLYVSILLFSGFLGYLWAGFTTKGFHDLGGLGDFMLDDEREKRKFFDKNIFVFMLSFSFFSLLMASPSLINRDIPLVRQVFLTLFLGAAFRFMFTDTSSSVLGNLLKGIIKLFTLK